MSSPAVTRESPWVAGAGAVVLGLALLAAVSGCDDRGTGEPAPDQRAADGGSRPEAEVAGSSAATGADDGAAAADLAALAPLLARAAQSPTLDDSQRLALEQAMQRLLQPAAGVCDGCSATVSYVDEVGERDHFRCDLRGADDDPVADLEIYHRPDLMPDAAKSWGRSTLSGHPASGLAGERLFVWPGRFEIRAFGRSESLRGERRLEELVSSLPLDALAKL
ncbi:MAG TPA: hypothetical protein VHR17_02105 [Thermoanaerobaculia bacterium]|jgi:hypothetical protein|nr:hypothetical protein [Thermoanaerobaculia bacterium]